MSSPLLVVSLLLGILVIGGASGDVVRSIERLASRRSASEALLGLLAALAADSPEITTATTALLRHEGATGAGVTVGSNAFLLGVLFGVGVLVNGTLVISRRALQLNAPVALAVALIAFVVLEGAVPPALGLVLAVLAAAPLFVAALWRREVPGASARRSVARWFDELADEERREAHELATLVVEHHPGNPRVRVARVLGALLVVIAASVIVEHLGEQFGRREQIPAALVGTILLAAVTGIPNAVAAWYLVRRRRGRAALATAVNSNVINVLAGLLLPATILGIPGRSTPDALAAAAYLALSVLFLGVFALAGRLTRSAGAIICGVYLLALLSMVRHR